MSQRRKTAPARKPVSPAWEIISQNLEALMIARWGATNVTKLARELAATKYKNPTREQYNVGVARRLWRSPADVSLESIAAAAAIFKLEPWQLLLPNPDPEAPQSVMSGHARETLEMFPHR